MDVLQLFYSFLFMTLILFKDVSSITLTVFQTSDKAIFGTNPFTVSCTYTLGANEQLYSIELKRKRESDAEFGTIVTFQNPSSTFNTTYTDGSLEPRTDATGPTTSTRTATLVFNQIECDDKASYRWNVFYSDGSNKEEHRDFSFVVKAETLFTQGGSVTFNPNTNIEEGDAVLFTCTGDVGNEPVGHLGWFIYLNNNTGQAVNKSSSAQTTAPVYQSNSCSYRRTSTLELTMTPDYHNILVRCTVQQDKFDQFGDGYVQTVNIPVYYSPRITAISDQTVDEGTESLLLSCVADAYPAPSYSWVLPDGTVSNGQTYTLTDLQVGDNGTYTCVVYNTYKGVNHTATETAYIDVRMTTTPTPTTSTTTPSAGTSDSGVTKSPASQDGGSDNKTTTIIVVCVVVGLVIIIAIVVVVLCVKKRSKPKEIEEPPEKPRNNQDLSFYGNRPDLVSSDHGMKNNMGNNMLNSSFNNSFDSTSDIKSRNEDGLSDVQFDDRPRSRRPIQLLDNMGGSGSYGDIVNPRV